MKTQIFFIAVFVVALVAEGGSETDLQTFIGQAKQNGITGDLERIGDAFTSKPFVNVIVWLRDSEFTSPDFQGDIEIVKREVKKIEDSVLLRLSPDDFKLTNRYFALNGFGGSVSEGGFKKLLEDSHVAEIYLDGEVKALLAESRPLVRAQDVEGLGVSGSGITVCVLDTGVDYHHPALGGCFGAGCKVNMGYDFCNGPDCSSPNDPDPMDEEGHGTHVAGIVASTDSSYRGMAPSANIAALKVLNATGSGTYNAINAGIDFCRMYKQTFNIKVMTMSLGAGGPYNPSNPNLGCPNMSNPALLKASKAGMFIDAASGNNAFNIGISYPACAPNVVSVGATYDADVGSQSWCLDPTCSQTCTDNPTQADQIVCMTNRGLNLDLLAPGAVINSAAMGGGFVEKSGTSMAAPHVAGIAALLFAVNPTLSPFQAESILKASGVPIYDAQSFLTFPRTDARVAASMAANPKGWTYDKGLTLFNILPAAYSPAAVADSQGNIHIVWHGSDYEIYYMKLNNSGSNITPEIQLTFNPTQSNRPAIAIDNNGFIHIAWTDWAGNYMLFYKKLDNNGVSVTPDIPITTSKDFVDPNNPPAIALDKNNNVHLVWSGNNNRVYYEKLNNNGLNLTPNIQLSSNLGSVPVIALDSSGNGHIAVLSSNPLPGISYIKINNKGQILVPDTSLETNYWLYYSNPTIAVDNADNIHVAFDESYFLYNTPSVIYYYLNNTGSKIIPYPSSWLGSDPSLAVDPAGNNYLTRVMYSTQPYTSQPYDLYYLEFDKTGSVTVPDTRLTFDIGITLSPVTVLDQKNATHVVWDDFRDGNPQIYYKRSIIPKCSSAQLSGSTPSSGNCLDKK